MRLLIPACVVAAALSCTLLAPETVTVVLPAPPEHWMRAFPDLDFQLLYWDAAGAPQRQDAPSAGTVAIPCSRRGNSPVLAFPCSTADVSGLLRPAGGLFPIDAEGSVLQLTWRNGPLALLMFRLRSVDRDTSLFNAGRLADYMAREPDPWALDLDAIAQRIADGTFSASDIDPLPRRDLTVVPGAGQWFLESPFSGVMSADPAGVLTVRSLALGMHGLFSTEGRALMLYVGPREAVVTEIR
jgi:hypothetical protein